MLIKALSDTNKPIGDGLQPTNSGWQGEPNLAGSNFVPYTVLTPMSANTAIGTFDESQADWHLPYSLASFGVSREQCEWMADKCRQLSAGLQHTFFGSGNDSFSIQQVQVLTIGGIQRVDTTNPPYFGQVDVISIWLAKEV
jgi:hypothetical protein